MKLPFVAPLGKYCILNPDPQVKLLSDILCILAVTQYTVITSVYRHCIRAGKECRDSSFIFIQEPQRKRKDRYIEN